MRHLPVLIKEVLESLKLQANSNIIDCTLGDGGHAEEILKKIAPDGKLLGIDLDRESILRAKQYLHEFADRTIFVRDSFENLKKNITAEKFGSVYGVLLDLGWSSPQFEERKRGFSFQKTDEPLDMRYDTLLSCQHDAVDPPLSADGIPLYGRCTAAEMLNHKDEEGLAEVLRKYGEEELSNEIAKAIVERRKSYTIELVGDLVDIILEVYRKKLKTDKEIPWIGGLHPATRVFQAIRIKVNDELAALESVLPQAVQVLESGGRLVVISFHSLEDRIIKHYFKAERGKTINIITKKPIVASDEEIKANPRARSAKLRVVEKI